MNMEPIVDCPQCGIKQADREPRYEIKDVGFSMLYCPICGNVWRRPANEESEHAANP